MLKTKIDVVLLSWNRLQDTIVAINSSLVQTGVDVTVYVVDQGSIPKVINGLKGYFQNNSKVIFHCLEENVGVAEGRNIGYRLGQSKYIFSLDNDAKFVNNDTLHKSVDLLNKANNISLITLKIINYTNEEDQEVRSLSNIYDDDKECDVVRFSGGAHLIKREIFEDVGGYDKELFFGGEEEELSRKIIINQGLIKYTPQQYVLHKVAREEKLDWATGRYYYLVRNRLYIKRKFGEKFILTFFYMIGYLIKGIYNGVLPQACRGIKDSFKMYSKFKNSEKDNRLYLENQYSINYFNKNESIRRGNFFKKIKNELFIKLPTS